MYVYLCDISNNQTKVRFFVKNIIMHNVNTQKCRNMWRVIKVSQKIERLNKNNRNAKFINSGGNWL